MNPTFGNFVPAARMLPDEWRLVNPSSISSNLNRFLWGKIEWTKIRLGFEKVQKESLPVENTFFQKGKLGKDVTTFSFDACHCQTKLLWRFSRVVLFFSLSFSIGEHFFFPHSCHIVSWQRTLCKGLLFCHFSKPSLIFVCSTFLEKNRLKLELIEEGLTKRQLVGGAPKGAQTLFVIRISSD